MSSDDDSDLTPEQRELMDATGCAHYGDPLPRWSTYDSAYTVHWKGYVQDPVPSDALRAEGHTVIVHGDAYWLMGNECALGPTRLPLDPPYDKILCEGLIRLIVVSKDGRSGISDGHAVVLVSETVADKARSVRGARVIDAQPDDWPDHDRVVLIDDLGEEIVGRYICVRVGDSLVQKRYVTMLRALGVTAVKVGGPLDPIVAPGVAAVMPVRDPGDEAEYEAI